MDRPIIVGAAEIDSRASMARSDISAMLTMLDYLIAQIGPIDEMTTTCLVMARKSLATLASGLPKPQ